MGLTPLRTRLLLVLLGACAAGLPAAPPLPAPPTALAQAQPAPFASARHSAWPVLLPSQASVTLRSGAVLRGRLIGLTPKALTLATGTSRRTLPLAELQAVEFPAQQELWLPEADGGRRRLRPIRGLSLPIDELPSSALRLDGHRGTATVDLTPVLTEAQFAKLTRNPNVVYVLNRLELAADGTLGLRVRPYGVQ